jgi:uncharacterized paraquat-inducible protein A
VRGRLSNLWAKLLSAALLLSVVLVGAAVGFDMRAGPLLGVAASVFALFCVYVFGYEIQMNVRAWWSFRRAGQWLRRRDVLKSRGLCPACAYDLTGNVSGVCPECGTARP